MLIFGLNPKIWITLGPVLVINAILLVSLFSYTFSRPEKKDPNYLAKRHTSKFLSRHLKEWWVFITDPIVNFFVKSSLTPSTLTFIGFVFSVVAAFLFAYGLFGFAGWVMIFGATFDLIDGRVARITKRESRSGAFYDSVMDRFGEGACLLGLAFYFRSSWILFFVIAALIGSMLVSYTRARAEGFGIECKGGAMQRPERIVYIGVSSILDPVSYIILSHFFAAPPPVLPIAAIIIVAVMTNATAVQRMIYVMNALDTKDASKYETLPQILTKLSTTAGRQAFFSKTRYGYDRSRSLFSSIIMFILDGADKRALKEMLDKGDLPNISEHILKTGSFVDAVSVFPSATGPSFTPFVTGSFPGTCNVPASKWFDKTIPSTKVLALNRFRDYMGWGAYAIDYDLSKSVRTIFEYSRRAVNIFGLVNRGCGIVRDPAFFRLYSLYRKAKRKADIEELEEAGQQWLSDAIRRGTDFIFYSFPSVDITGMNKIGGKKALDEAYRRFDALIGKTVSLIKENNEKAAILIASDHSHGIFQSSFDMASHLEKRMPTLRYPARMKTWHDVSAIPLVSGTSMAHIYLKKDKEWSVRCFFEEMEENGLTESLIENSAVDLIAGRSLNGGVIVKTKAGRAHLIEDADGRITYMADGNDPFGLSHVPKSLDQANSLLITRDSERPDVIVQLLQIFRSARTGDLVISAAKGHTLNSTARQTTHGSILKEHTLVPFLSSVPIKNNFIRTVDIFSLVLDLMGIEAEHKLDGSLPEYLEEKDLVLDSAQTITPLAP